MVFGLFSKEKGLQRTIARATNKLSQQADRWRRGLAAADCRKKLS